MRVERRESFRHDPGGVRRLGEQPVDAARQVESLQRESAARAVGELFGLRNDLSIETGNRADELLRVETPACDSRSSTRQQPDSRRRQRRWSGIGARADLNARLLRRSWVDGPATVRKHGAQRAEGRIARYSRAAL